MYADYEYYANSFSGGLIPSDEFNSLSLKAERYLNYVTGYKAEKLKDGIYSERIRFAVCLAAETLYETKQRLCSAPPGIKSENTDGYSVTYSDVSAETVREESKAAMLDAFQTYLSGTGLLYRGVTG